MTLADRENKQPSNESTDILRTESNPSGKILAHQRPSPTDHELMILIRDDNWEAFSLLYERYWKGLYLAAYNIIRNREACEDIVQDVMVELWDKRNERSVRSLQAYLYTSVRYQVFKLIRAGKVNATFLENSIQTQGVNETEHMLREKELVGLLDERIAELPMKCRTVFVMSRKEHLSISEIAAKLNITSKTVENHLSNALSKLRTGLKDQLFCFFIFLSTFFLK